MGYTLLAVAKTFVVFVNAALRDPDIGIAAFETVAEPKLVGLDKRKNLFESNGVSLPDNQELLAVSDQLRDVLAEQAEGRIRHHDVRLLQKFDAFFTSEISISIKLLDVSVFMVAVVHELDAMPVLLVSCR